MGQCQLMKKTTSVSGAERKDARTWSGFNCVQDVLPLPYRK